MTQSTSGQGLFGRTEAQLSAHHGGRQQVPFIIADGAPLPVFQHLHSALAHDGAPAKTDQRLLERKNAQTIAVGAENRIVVLSKRMNLGGGLKPGLFPSLS